MSIDLTNTVVTSIISAAVAGIVVYIVKQLSIAKPKQNTVPYSDAGFLETVRAFTGTDLPLFFLYQSKKIQERENGLKNFRLNFPLAGGWYSIGDIHLIRKILQDPTTVKATRRGFISKTFNVQETMFSAPNNSLYWKMMRKSTSHAFAKTEITRMKDVAIDITNKWCTNEAIHKFCIEPLDPSREMVKLSFKTISVSAFEYVPTDDEIDEFTKNLIVPLREAYAQITNRYRETFGFFIPTVRRAIENCTKLQQFGYRILHSYRTNTNKSNNNTLIKIIVSNEKLTDEQRVAEIFTYYVAGHDTTGYTISSTIVLLARNPKILTKLRSEANGIPPDQWCTSCTYFKYIVKESMRILPVAALGSARRINKDYEDSNGYIIPCGATVMLTQVVPSYDTTVFGIDSDQYNPDRWYKATTDMNDTIIPFSLGSRNCIGMSLANSEIDFILPLILSKFDLVLVEDGEEEFFLTWKVLGAKVLLKPLVSSST